MSLPFEDPILLSAAKSIELPDLEPVSDYFNFLVRSVIYQQLNGKAASVIYGRFCALFPSAAPQAAEIIDKPDETLRSVGLSAQKSAYIRQIARFAMQNDFSDSYLDSLSDEDVIRYLTQIKGVGRWTVEMLLIFGMARPDVFPADDYGILTGMRELYGIDPKLPLKEQKRAMTEISEAWRPNRSLAVRYIWAYKDLKMKK